METKLFYSPYMVKNIFSIVCFVVVTIGTVIIYSTLDDLSYIEGFKVFLLLALLEMSSLFYLWLKNRKKENYISFDDETITIVRNNRKVEYNINQAKIATIIPNCLEYISFVENYSLSSIYFTLKDFDFIKKQIKKSKKV